ncbi:MAG TPA: family 1 encapsulin nanocompartment shell protein [Blastocatellia bacterium]|nr:family 1 encapsulin nanocompartment shell protein [Blastocatellia bacterium]
MNHPWLHVGNPLSPEEWERISKIVATVGGSGVVRRMLATTGPLGSGMQTVPREHLVGITDGRVGILGNESLPVRFSARSGAIVPLIFKDFVLHWRDVLESRLERRFFSPAKAAAAAAFLALEEDKLVLFGDAELECPGLLNATGAETISGLKWENPGDAFKNLVRIRTSLQNIGHNGALAALVHPQIYSGMHRVIKGSGLLEIEHVKSILPGGVFKSPLLGAGTGLVVATAKQNLELLVAVDTTVAFLGARNMNLPFRVLKAVYLRINRPDAICGFRP